MRNSYGSVESETSGSWAGLLVEASHASGSCYSALNSPSTCPSSLPSPTCTRSPDLLFWPSALASLPQVVCLLFRNVSSL